MIQVWKEINNNHGKIEELQEKLGKEKQKKKKKKWKIK